MQRQAATHKGMLRRIRDLHFEKVTDPRYGPNVDYPLPTVLTALVCGLVTMARSLRAVERRTAQIAQQHDCSVDVGISGRIADNTLGNVLPRLDVGELAQRLHALVKAENRRGNLDPTVLPLGTAAIDGKNVAILHWYDLCRVLELDPQTTTPEQVKTLLGEKFPFLQICIPKHGQPYALARMHTVTLISSRAACCIHERPIPGHTNEIGAMPELIKELHAVYGHTGMVEMLTTDAGNTSLKVATMTVEELGWDYFSQIKSEHGDLYTEAVRALEMQGAEQADESYGDKQNGLAVTYHGWHHDLSETGWLNWTHARQVVRVQRTTENPNTGETTVGNRYYVCSRNPEALAPADALRISRAHWRCENETHWTADAELREDMRQLSWSRHPNGVFVVSLLRMIALSILAVARKLSRLGYSKETPTWHQVAEHFLLVLCASTLLTDEFDAVTEE